MKITILLADDHPVVRRGLQCWLEDEPDLEVVGAVSGGREVAPAAERLRPDVLLLDLLLPELGGLGALRQVKQRAPETRIVILSILSDEEHVLAALRAGASGYVAKECVETEVVRAVREVAAGRRYLSPPLAELAMDAYLEQPRPCTAAQYETLTRREREVFLLSARGMTGGEVAAKLRISRRTVESHRAHLMRKLGLHGQAELIRYALRRGLLPIDD
jgi:DNA-binding NarL/FixJ family response regulator